MKINTLDFDTQVLRDKILDLAMKGKLVPQDSSDEPASVLLDKIKSEKDELVKEKKIKKGKMLPEIAEKEKPFVIPDGWKWIRLGDILLQTIGGGTPAKNVSGYWNGNIPWISVKDVHDNETEITSTQDSITREGMLNSATNLIKANSLIVVMRMAVGRIAVTKIDACINQDLRALITSKHFYDKYLLYIYSRLHFETSGITVKGLKINTLLNTPFPLPPLEEQKRIADKISQLFDRIGKIESASQQYTELQSSLKSRLIDVAMHGKLVKQEPTDEPASILFDKIKAEKAKLVKEKKIRKSKPLPEITDNEKPFGIPDGWEWVRLGDIAEVIMGQSPKGDTVNTNGDGVEFHQGKTEFTNMIINKSNKYTTSLNKVVSNEYIVMAVRAPVGDVNLLDRKIVIGRGLAGIKAYICDKQYIFYYLNSIKPYYEQRSTGTTFKAINGKVIRDTPVPLPPLEEQNRIVTKLEKVLSTL